jgi:hypothetical protein
MTKKSIEPNRPTRRCALPGQGRVPAGNAVLVVIGILISACSGKTTGEEPSRGAPLDGGDASARPELDATADDVTQERATRTDAGGPLVPACGPGPAPLRRLSSFEYDNTIRDLLGDSTRPAAMFDYEPTVNGFANDADGREVSITLAENYHHAAARIAAAATSSAAAMASLAPCAAAVTDATALSCARTIADGFASRAFRRSLTIDEADELIGLFTEVQGAGADFPTAVAAVLSAVLQSPEFLYRVEWGVSDPARPNLRRPTGDEMAARLSYLFWGSVPDAALRDAATSGELLDAAGVRAQAQRLLDDPRSHQTVRYFFEKLLGLDELPNIARAEGAFSTDTAAWMREETGRLIEQVVFQDNGSWPSLLTAPYTFVNEPLARHYGVAGVQGDAFVRVELDTSQRLGLLTQGGVMSTVPTSNAALVALRRGGFVANRLLCRGMEVGEHLEALTQPVPQIAPGMSERQRVTAWTAESRCMTCHGAVNTLGFALERYDTVGLYRTEQDGVPIDARVDVPGIAGTIDGGVELARKLAELPEAQDCFADQWLAFAHGRKLQGSDVCLREGLHDAFRRAGFNVRQLLVELTQTDAFLFLPANE